MTLHLSKQWMEPYLQQGVAFQGGITSETEFSLHSLVPIQKGLGSRGEVKQALSEGFSVATQESTQYQYN